MSSVVFWFVWGLVVLFAVFYAVCTLLYDWCWAICVLVLIVLFVVLYDVSLGAYILVALMVWLLWLFVLGLVLFL